MNRNTIEERIREIVGDEDAMTERQVVDRVATRVARDVEHEVAQLRSEIRAVLHDLERAGEYDREPGPDGGTVVPAVRTATELVYAIQAGHMSIVRRALTRDLGPTALHAGLVSAVINNRADAVRWLLDAGADATAPEPMLGKTPWMFVGPRTNPSIIRALEEAGAGERASSPCDAPN